LNFDQFLGLDGQLQWLKADFSGGRFVHAYLFSGPSGTGKRSNSEICARAVHCMGLNRPCDECAPCRRMLAGTHPDHHVVEASGRSIGVDEIRDLVRTVSIKPFEAGHHTIILADAEKMTVQAQNALLKTLETPPGNAVFFLLSTSPAQLLATISSRCRHVRFHPIRLDEAQLALCARGIAPSKAEAAASAASGCVGQALEILDDAHYWALRERVIASLSALKEGPSAVAEAAKPLASDKENALRILEILEGIARDMMRSASGLAPEQSDFEQLSSAGLAGETLMIGVQTARQKLSANVSWQTVLEMMYFDSLRGKIPWQQ
jgi:DNA polymerase-3 subunit delta'